MILLGVLAFVFSLVFTLLARRLLKRFAGNYDSNAIQRFHFGDTPRVGGLGIFFAWFGAFLVLPLSDVFGFSVNINVGFDELGFWFLVLAPAFFGAVAEDLTQRLRVSWRMVLTFVSACLAAWFFGLSISRLGFSFVDAFWSSFSFLGILLAVFAIAGLPHAFNLIDGYNGLMSSIALTICLALVHVCLQVGDRQLAAYAGALAATTAGFLVWNYPKGLIFAGDSGAYFLGLVISIICIKLVQRHDVVSPWFVMLLLIYPVWEVIFSAYRKITRGDSPSMADALHLHQLIYKRLIANVLYEDEAKNMLAKNNRIAPYLWSFCLVSVIPAVLFWRYSFVLFAFCFVFIVFYIWAYISLVRFKVPRILQK